MFSLNIVEKGFFLKMELAIFEILLRLPELSTLKIESLGRLLIYKVYKGVWTGVAEAAVVTTII